MAQEWLEYLKESGWLDVLKVVGPSSVISVIISIGWNAWRDAGQRKGDRKEAALSVALSLESYARICRAMMHRADWASDEAMRTNSYQPISGVKLPDFSFPDKLEWKWLKHKVTSELREFPATLHSTREFLGSVGEYGDPMELCDEVEFECAKAAKQALELARMTRRKHGAVPWKPGAKDSDLERELSDYITRSEEKRRTLRERHKQFAADLKAENALTDQK
ncbi:hypothetical protein [Trinickia mobilis]|uniref:hypothetical protein n=1 Tax=Trinickia mobilis TaxID=2816356 RepID=UPI001A8E8BAA|nr:hypothetical protein [Trinickia mobilis]